MNAQDYHRQLISLIDSVRRVSSDISFREIDANACYVKMILTFATGHERHLAEYVEVERDSIRRLKYRYQLLDKDKRPLARWDNARHHKSIETFPDHRHNSTDKPHPSRPMSPVDAMAESLALIESKE